MAALFGEIVTEAPETHYVRSGDAHIAYQVFGDGPIDLVSMSNWVNAMDSVWDGPTIAGIYTRFGTFSRFVHYDRRGVSLSDPVSPTDPPTLEDWVQDAIADGCSGCRSRRGSRR